MEQYIGGNSCFHKKAINLNGHYSYDTSGVNITDS